MSVYCDYCSYMITKVAAEFARFSGLPRRSKSSANELYILWSKLRWHKLSPTLATSHYYSPDNAIGLVVQSELSGYVRLD